LAASASRLQLARRGEASLWRGGEWGEGRESEEEVEEEEERV